MTGILSSGRGVEVRRPRPKNQLHPLRHGTVAENRSTMIQALRGAGHGWKFISEVMRCSVATCHLDAAVPPVRLHEPEGYADAG